MKAKNYRQQIANILRGTPREIVDKAMFPTVEVLVDLRCGDLFYHRIFDESGQSPDSENLHESILMELYGSRRNGHP